MLTGIRLRYDETEDRIVLKTTRVDDGIETELNLLITRRACIGWRADMKAMTEIAQREPQSVFRQPGATLRKAVGGTAHLAAGTAAEAAQPRPADLQPATDGAQLLVSAVECARRRADGKWLIKFRIKDQPMLTLVLTDDSLQRTATGLDKLLPKCDWAMPPMKLDTITKASGNPGSLH